ncbi:MAG: hypothetical protein V4537_14230 [Pseudomonadota bacterium]
MNKVQMYPRTRADLVIETTGGAKLGNCYSATYYRVTSSPFRLKREQLLALNKAGVLGFGQEFDIKSQCDGKEAPAGADESVLTEVDTRMGKPTGEAPRNYRGEKIDPLPSHRYEYFVYECVARCDSGD